MIHKKLIIFGTGDFAELANSYFSKDTELQVECFTTDQHYIKGNIFCGRPVVAFEKIEDKFPPSRYAMFIAIGYSKMNKVRQAKYETAKEKGYQLASYVSPNCKYLTDYPPGDNTFIFEDNTIQPFVKIGNNVILWSGNHIGHHSEIEDHNFISSHVVISGRCLIKQNCFFGVNSSVGDGVIIEEKTLLGAGSTTTKNTVAKGVYLPAKTVLFPKTSDQLNI